MRRMTHMFTVGRMAGCLIAVALYGCSLGPAETGPVRTYLLNPDFFISANVARNNHASLLISVPKGQPGFDTPRMAYLLRQHELGYYAFSQWVDTPGRMLLRGLAQTMEATGRWYAVVQAPSTVRPDYRLDCDNVALEQQFFSQPSRVRFALRAQLVDAKRQSIIGARNFEVLETSSSEDAYGGVIAANQAATKLLDELSYWVVTVMDEDLPYR